MLPMLALNPRDRPTIDTILSSPYIARCERLDYKVLFSRPRRLSANATKNALDKITKYTNDEVVIEWTLRILQRSCGCPVRGDDRIYGCLWLASKIVKRSPPKDLVFDYSVERKIGEYTQWRFIGVSNNISERTHNGTSA
jgi:hypothetical protein